MLSLPSSSGSGHGIVSATNKEIQLVDADFEDHRTLNSFLILVTKLQWDIKTEDLVGRRAFIKWRSWLLKLLYFIDKYDSETGARALQLWGAQMCIMGHWYGGYGLQNGFVFGALTNNVSLCEELVTYECDAVWANETAPLGSRESGHLLEVSGFPYELSCAIPLAYLFALTRARLSGEPGSAPFAKEFRKVVTAALNATGKCPASWDKWSS